MIGEGAYLGEVSSPWRVARVVSTRVVVGRHVIENSRNIEGSGWGSGSDNRCTCR